MSAKVKFKRLNENNIQICYRCHISKPVTDFYKSTVVKTGYKRECKLCALERHLIKNYGITWHEYGVLLKQQDNKCATCGTSNPIHFTNNDTHFAIDHDHKTGKIRGLLCKSCNLVIGNSRENIAILNNIINYLKKHQCQK